MIRRLLLLIPAVIAIGCSVPPEVTYLDSMKTRTGEFATLAQETATREATNAIPGAQDLQSRVEQLRSDIVQMGEIQRQMEALVPPEKLQAFHREVIARVEAVRTQWERLAKALSSGDKKEIEKMRQEAQRAATGLGTMVSDLAKKNGVDFGSLLGGSPK